MNQRAITVRLPGSPIISTPVEPLSVLTADLSLCHPEPEAKNLAAAVLRGPDSIGAGLLGRYSVVRCYEIKSGGHFGRKRQR